ncbi:MAG: hypothetical protein HPY50_19890 [Firmicutes bacterium]|nr:hypothetical protein [Bacillota bacterium]
MAEVLGDRLPANLYQFFSRTTMTGVASTIDSSGLPRGAPMSMFYAPDEKMLLMGVQNRSATFENATREGKIALTFIGGGDMAFSIQGRARVFKQQMESSRYVGIIAVFIESVKSNVADDVEVKKGIKVEFRSPQWEELIRKVLAELRGCTREQVLAAM